jgi:hypothetical protein
LTSTFIAPGRIYKTDSLPKANFNLAKSIASPMDAWLIYRIISRWSCACHGRGKGLQLMFITSYTQRQSNDEHPHQFNIGYFRESAPKG